MDKNKEYLNDLMQVYNDGRLTLFIGAGCSIPFGLPSWSRIIYDYIESISEKNVRDKLIEYLTEYFGCNKEEIEKLKCNENTKNIDLTKLANCIEVIVKKIGNINDKTLKKFVEETTKNYNKDYSKDHYLEETELKIKNYITTNYDTIIEDYLKRKNVGFNVPEREKPNEHFNPNNINILKVHGSNSLDMVLSEKDYANFRKKGKYLYDKMHNLFAETTILFLGYSLEDPDIRNFIQSVEFKPDIYFLSYKAVSEKKRDVMEETLGIKVIQSSEGVGEIYTPLELLKDIRANINFGESEITNQFSSLIDKDRKDINKGELEKLCSYVRLMPNLIIDIINKKDNSKILYDNVFKNSYYDTYKEFKEILAEKLINNIVDYKQLNLDIIASILALDYYEEDDSIKYVDLFNRVYGDLSLDKREYFMEKIKENSCKYFESNEILWKIINGKYSIGTFSDEFNCNKRIYNRLKKLNLYNVVREREIQEYDELCKLVADMVYSNERAEYYQGYFQGFIKSKTYKKYKDNIIWDMNIRGVSSILKLKSYNELEICIYKNENILRKYNIKTSGLDKNILILDGVNFNIMDKEDIEKINDYIYDGQNISNKDILSEVEKKIIRLLGNEKFEDSDNSCSKDIIYKFIDKPSFIIDEYINKLGR